MPESPEQRAVRMAAWRQKNAAHVRRYARENRARKAQRAAERYREDPERYANKSRVYRTEHPQRWIAAGMVAGAQRRADAIELPFDITHDWVLARLSATEACECCGRLFHFGPKGGRRSDDSATLDRLIPKIGYTRDNVALLCWRCNRLKSDATADELQRLATWLRGKQL